MPPARKTAARGRANAPLRNAAAPARFRPPSDVLARLKKKLALAESDHIRSPNVFTFEETVIPARRAAFEAHLAEAEVPQELRDWAERMTIRKDSATVDVGPHRGLPWILALMVIRYGEALDTNVEETVLDDNGVYVSGGGVIPNGGTRPFWPSVLGQEDIDRALAWENGDIPARIRIVNAELTPATVALAPPPTEDPDEGLLPEELDDTDREG